jgi:hypothetical protein
VHGEFTITGSWTQLYHVLRLVEELPTRVVINQFNVRRTDMLGGAGNVESWSGSLSLDLTSLKAIQ